MKKLILCFFATCCFIASLWSFDVSGEFHVDTYGTGPSVGFSFLAEEYLMDTMKIKAQAEYLMEKNYDVQTLVIGNISKFVLGGGFTLGIKNDFKTPIIPGIEGVIGLQVTKNFGIETSAVIAFTPSDSIELYGIRAKLDFLYKSENTDSSVSYTLKKGISVNETVNTLNIDVEAFEPNFPVGLLIGSKMDFIIAETGKGFNLHLTGGLSFITKKYGTYFAKTQIGVISQKENGGIPYDIAVGAKYSF